jgi:hypothetical protein
MATTEHTINDALASVLRKTRFAWRSNKIVLSEQSGMLKEGAGQPDILIIEQNVSPVVVEVEITPAITVEYEAKSRLGNQLRSNGRRILSSIAVRLPTSVRGEQGSQLREEIAKLANIEMAIFTGSSPNTYLRWPQSGWMIGTISELSILIQSASVPPEIIDEATDQLVSGVKEASGLLNGLLTSHPGSILKISQELCQEQGDQTNRMACTILTNAFVFQEILAGGPNGLSEVLSVEQLLGSTTGLTKSSVLGEWRKILEVNYWPIFDISRRILEDIPTEVSSELIHVLTSTANKLVQNRLMRSHDLTGAVFQRLISDRKFLAAFYTTPASASLLSGLAISENMLSGDRSWANSEDVTSLRIADFACGTGTLLSSVYQRVCQLHEFFGGDSEKIHADMMSNSLVGCDVLPAATHLTASTLSGIHPSTTYTKSQILTVPYGKQEDGTISLGSLDLLTAQGQFSLLAPSAIASEGTGSSEQKGWQLLPHSSFDLVIMNPPFTRDTGQEGQKIGVPNPMFAAFSSSAEEQKVMAKATEKLIKGTSVKGNAGEASIFLVLAHRKLKDNGVLALIMPLSLLAGESWEGSRSLIANNYSNIMIVSISGLGGGELSFSADTSMGECLVIGTKTNAPSDSATFITLYKKPQHSLVGSTTAEQIKKLISCSTIRHLEDGPVGGTPISFGNDVIGNAVVAPLPSSGSWNISRISDLSLAQTAFQLIKRQRVWLPSMNESEAFEIPIVPISNFGKIGPYHSDINGDTQNGSIRGPFKVTPIQPNRVSTYPVLWSHDASRERSIVFEADSEGSVKTGKPSEKLMIDRKVSEIWNSASHCHFNRDFRFNSQSTSMQYTQRKTIGGRAWLSIKLQSDDFEKVLVLWSNTSLGLLLYWWHSSKQQAGRGSIGKLMLETFPVLNLPTLSRPQIEEGVNIFNYFSNKEMLPFHNINNDQARRELDQLFFTKVLNCDQSILLNGGPLDILRMKLGLEPSILG